MKRTVYKPLDFVTKITEITNTYNCSSESTLGTRLARDTPSQALIAINCLLPASNSCFRYFMGDNSYMYIFFSDNICDAVVIVHFCISNRMGPSKIKD